MRSFKNISAIIFSSLILGCNLEQDINIGLPKHESQMVVESYLEPGKQIHLLLTESSPYLDPPAAPFINDALVTVTYNNITDTLYLNTEADDKTSKYYNYISNRTVPENYERDFALYIKDSKGREATAKTKLIKSVAIDTLEYRFKNDSSAYILTSFFDDTSTDNYYRILIHKDSLSRVVQRFEFTDELAETSKISIGTGYDFKKGNKAFVTLYHLDKAYYEYLESIESAREANFNPFSQPSMIKSNINGGIGIFTGLASDHKTTMIE